MPEGPLPELPPLYVSSAGSDDMGAVLTELGLEYTALSESSIAAMDCGVVMLNCDGGWESEVSLDRLEEFLRQGGSVIASDHASTAVEAMADATFTTKAIPTTKTATIVDDELAELLGQETVEIRFNMPAWHLADQIPHGADSLLTADVGLFSSSESILAYKLSVGEGTLVYTSFHNHAQTSDVEEALLHLLLMVPIAASSETTVRDTYTTIVGDSAERTSRADTKLPSSGSAEPTAQSDSEPLTVQLRGLGSTECALTWDLAPGETVRLGREDFTGCQTVDVLNYISGTHCALQRSDDGETVLLTDLDSTNGTRVDGRAVTADSSRPLSTGARLSLGGERLEFEVRYSV